MSSTTTVRVSKDTHKILAEHAAKTGKKLQFLLERAILRCYGAKQ